MELAEVGVRTRAMAATGTVRNKRRRLLNDDGEAENKVTSSTTSTTSYIQLRSRRILVDHQRQRDETRCLSPNSDHDDEASCCSTNNGSSDKRIIELPDLEDESIDEGETSTNLSSGESTRETAAVSELRVEPEDLDSTSRPSEANSRRRSTVKKRPHKAELEEFFASAEKELQIAQKQFIEKYNYDIFKDEPLEGRYEWVRLSPPKPYPSQERKKIKQ